MITGEHFGASAPSACACACVRECLRARVRVCACLCVRVQQPVRTVTPRRCSVGVQRDAGQARCRRQLECHVAGREAEQARQGDGQHGGEAPHGARLCEKERERAPRGVTVMARDGNPEAHL